MQCICMMASREFGGRVAYDGGCDLTEETGLQDRLKITAERALAAMDLTSLGDSDDAEIVSALCDRAVTDAGRVAAVCVWPRFIGLCRERLAGKDIPVAVVVNFPYGGADIGKVVAEIEAAVTDGADEIDLVWPYDKWMTGQHKAATRLLSVARDTAGDRVLKVILETGRLADPALIDSASRAAIEAGADFIKTSTGKVEVNATPEAAEIMLKVIAETGGSCGFKAAGGIRTVANADIYFQLADRILGPDWATPARFRIGASGLLDDIIATLDGVAPAAAAKGY